MPAQHIFDDAPNRTNGLGNEQVMTIARRALLLTALGAASAVATGRGFAAADSHFAEWVERFRARARARGILATRN